MLVKAFALIKLNLSVLSSVFWLWVAPWQQPFQSFSCSLKLWWCMPLVPHTQCRCLRWLYHLINGKWRIRVGSKEFKVPLLCYYREQSISQALYLPLFKKSTNEKPRGNWSLQGQQGHESCNFRCSFTGASKILLQKYNNALLSIPREMLSALRDSDTDPLHMSVMRFIYRLNTECIFSNQLGSKCVSDPIYFCV